MRVRMLDRAVKALMVDDAHTVEQLMVPICQSIGIENHFEYSLVWEEKPKVIKYAVNKNKYQETIWPLK